MRCVVVTQSKLLVVVFIWVSLGFSTLVLAGPSPDQRCRARIYEIIGGYIDCISRAAAAFEKNEDRDRYARNLARCEVHYDRRYDRALDRWPDACPTLEKSEEAAQQRLETSVEDFTGEVFGLISGAVPNAVAGKAILYNNCTVPVKLMSPTNPSIDGTVLEHLENDVLDLRTDFNGNQANAILAAPVTTADQCAAVDCSAWQDIMYAPPPPNGATNTKQRTGTMYEGTNLPFGAYCQPTNAAAAQCTTDSSTPCCGPHMNFDKSFGTQWEITPFDSVGNDTIDLTTNYGTGPNSPPPLCPPGGGVDCVTASANIFYNVPIAIEMSGGSCSCGDLGSRDSIECTEISCTDAFQHPTDNKNCSCSSGGQRGYVITYCPAGSPLPPLP
jgi:hypothetical protein